MLSGLTYRDPIYGIEPDNHPMEYWWRAYTSTSWSSNG